MPKMEMSLESITEIGREMRRIAMSGIDIHTMGLSEGERLRSVFLDNDLEAYIGDIVFASEFVDGMAFVPNGDWFGTEVEKLG